MVFFVVFFSIIMSHAILRQFLGHTYAKKLLVAHLKFKFNKVLFYLAPLLDPSLKIQSDSGPVTVSPGVLHLAIDTTVSTRREGIDQGKAAYTQSQTSSIHSKHCKSVTKLPRAPGHKEMPRKWASKVLTLVHSSLPNP